MTKPSARVALVAIAALGLGGALRAQDAPSLGELLQGTHVHGLAIEGGRLLLATHHGLFALDPETGEVAPLGESRQDFMGFSVGDGGRFYASGHPEVGGNSGVLLSTDGGASWSKLSDGVEGPVDFHQMAVSPADPDTLYGAHAGALQRSRDAGASWEVVAPAPDGLIDLAASGLGAEILYAATETGLLRSKDGGESWAPAHPAQAPVSFVETGPEGTVRAFVLGEGLVVRASEEELDWTVVSEPLGGDYMIHFATDGHRAFAATGSGALLVSEDGGETWSVLGG